MGIGEILWDLLPEGKQLGGAPANFAYHAKCQGEESSVVSAVGEDPLGEEILAYLERINLDTKYIKKDQYHPTGTVEVKLDKNGKPDYIIHTEVAWDNISMTKSVSGLATKLDAVCFGSLAQRSEVSAETISQFIEITSTGCLRIFDINIRQNFYNSDIIEKSLRLANCFKINEDEFSLIAQMFSFTGSEENIVEKFISNFDLKIIALTKGEEGSCLYTNNECSYLKSDPVDVVDTVGAGDAFTASLCSGLLRDYPLEKIHRQATGLAAYVCTQKGATPEIPESFQSNINQFL